LQNKNLVCGIEIKDPKDVIGDLIELDLVKNEKRAFKVKTVW